MGKSQKAKGNRGEVAARKLFEDAGFNVIRGKQKDEQDLLVDGFGEVEVKYGKHVPKTVYNFFGKGTTNAVMMKRTGKGERKPWLVVVPFDLFLHLLR